MKITHVETLLACGSFATSAEWRSIRRRMHKAIQAVDWPVGSGKFTIYPESGKKRGKGNGVKPIKSELMKELAVRGWKLEEPLDIAILQRPGKLDAVLYSKSGPVAFEWETGNISSSHRALNKMALGLLKGVLICGMLVVPSRQLYRYLTDRIGNFPELQPYLDLWKVLPCRRGVLEIIVVEHDATSTDVPRVPKGTSGRALS
ncbi:MAG TPA: hypothetical protein VG013_23820 [Gemmataceae bacterium]|jgi:hypothetical protein|nr:hypothetical protein [Gemmataceae bacterium]